MDNGNVFLEHFARLMEDKRECMELIQEDTSIREMLTEVASGVTQTMKQITASGVHEVFAVDTKSKLYRCRKPCVWIQPKANHGV